MKRKLWLILAILSLAASIGLGAAYAGGKRSGWYVCGGTTFVFDPDKAGDQQRAKDSCDAYAKTQNKTCTGPVYGNGFVPGT